jgi:drug/metabolite transporter (DMT)-like permease
MFASMGAAVKLASMTLDNEVIVFMRNALGLVLILPLVLRNGGLASLTTDVPHLHLLRASAGVAAMYCFFYALGELPLADGMLLKMTAPIFIPLIAFIWLSERPGWLAIVAVPIGFAGVLLVLGPRGEIHPASLIGLLGGILAALAKVTVRGLTHTEPATRIVFYFAVFAMLISAVPLLWAWQTPSWGEFGILLFIAAAGTTGQFLLTRGYGAASASQVGPFTYFSVVFAAGYGYLFWEETLSLQFLSGALLIALAGIMALRKRSVAVKRPDIVDLARDETQGLQ